MYNHTKVAACSQQYCWFGKYNPPQVSFLGSPPRGGPCVWMSWGDAVVELQKSVKKGAVPLLVVLKTFFFVHKNTVCEKRFLSKIK